MWILTGCVLLGVLSRLEGRKWKSEEVIHKIPRTRGEDDDADDYDNGQNNDDEYDNDDDNDNNYNNDDEKCNENKEKKSKKFMMSVQVKVSLIPCWHE